MKNENELYTDLQVAITAAATKFAGRNGIDWAECYDEIPELLRSIAELYEHDDE